MKRSKTLVFISSALLLFFLAPPASAEDEACSPTLKNRTLYKKAGSAVVLILGTDNGKSGSAGTGSIITKSGQIITNSHVIYNAETKAPFTKIYVYLKPDKLTGDNRKDLKLRYKAKVVDYTKGGGRGDLDLAYLQVENPPANLPIIEFVAPDEVYPGDEVVAIGHPETAGLWTLTTGAISTVIANFQRINGKDIFQTSAAVNRGNSGGPLLNQCGQMVGINTAISRKAADGLAIVDINYALKSSVAVAWLNQKGVNVSYAPAHKASAAVAVKTPPPAPTLPKTKPDAPPVQEKVIKVEKKGESKAAAKARIKRATVAATALKKKKAPKVAVKGCKLPKGKKPFQRSCNGK